MIDFTGELPPEWAARWAQFKESTTQNVEVDLERNSGLQRDFDDYVHDEAEKRLLPIIKGLTRMRPEDRISASEALRMLDEVRQVVADAGDQHRADGRTEESEQAEPETARNEIAEDPEQAVLVPEAHESTSHWRPAELETESNDRTEKSAQAELGPEANDSAEASRVAELETETNDRMEKSNQAELDSGANGNTELSRQAEFGRETIDRTEESNQVEPQPVTTETANQAELDPEAGGNTDSCKGAELEPGTIEKTEDLKQAELEPVTNESTKESAQDKLGPETDQSIGPE